MEPCSFLIPFAVLELNPACAREILAKKMRRARLDRSPVLRHRFDRQCLDRAGKTFALGFFAAVNRNGEVIAHERFVNIEHPLGFRACFRFAFVDSMTFLPEKFGCAQK